MKPKKIVKRTILKALSTQSRLTTDDVLKINPSSYLEASRSDLPSIYQLKTEDIDYATAMITIVLAGTKDYFKDTQCLNIKQIQVISNGILSDYKNMKLSELKLAIKYGCMAKYGPVYGSLNGNIIFHWLEQFVLKSREARHYSNG